MTFSTGTTFAPPTQPTVNGRLLTVDTYLNNPGRIQNDFVAMASDYFLSDRLCGPGPEATGGSILYDQVQAGQWFMVGDAQQINPGQEFPLNDMEDVAPLVARTSKWGSAFQLTYEDIRRNRRDKLADGMNRLRNTVTKKVDAITMAVVRSAPIINQVASGSFADPATPIMKDVFTGLRAVKHTELGYRITGAIISSNTELNIMTNDKLSDLAARSGEAVVSPLISQQLGRLFNLNWYVNERCDDDEMFLVAEKVAAKISDEVPLYTRVVDEPKRERKLVMAGRLTVPVVDNPKAVVRITGINE